MKRLFSGGIVVLTILALALPIVVGTPGRIDGDSLEHQAHAYR